MACAELGRSADYRRPKAASQFTEGGDYYKAVPDTIAGNLRWLLAKAHALSGSFCSQVPPKRKRAVLGGPFSFSTGG